MLIFGFAVATSACRADAPVLSAEPNTLSRPGGTVLRWSVANADKAYLSGVGIVPSAGTRTVQVPSTMTFWLAAERKDSIAFGEVTVVVGGEKGSGGFPALDFVRQRRDAVAADDLPSVLDTFHRVLQDDLSCRVQGPLNEENTSTLETDWRDSPELVGANESTIGGRRVAYQVRTFKSDAAYGYAIGTVVHYRRRIELTWYPEPPGSPRYRDAADMLNARFVQAFAHRKQFESGGTRAR